MHVVYEGRRRRVAFPMQCHVMYSIAVTLVLCSSSILRIAEACSSRSTPKPRPPVPTSRPNITFPTFACPPAYATWYCLNGATCFTVEIQESILYNCVCADGYTGPRCEFKDLDGSYLPSREKIMVERASIAGGVTLAILFIVVLSIAFYTWGKRKKKEKSCGGSAVPSVEEIKRKPFHSHSSHPSRKHQSQAMDPESGEAHCTSPSHLSPTTRSSFNPQFWGSGH